MPSTPATRPSISATSPCVPGFSSGPDGLLPLNASLRRRNTASRSSSVYSRMCTDNYLPGKEALARLLSQLTLGDLVPQQLRWLEPRPQLRREVFGDRQPDVESHQVGELQRAH